MRLTSLTTWLLMSAAVLASSPQQSTTSTTSSLPPNPTACGDLINQAEHLIIVNASQAVDCLRSVPFNAAVASQFLQYLNDTIQFQSTLAYLANPPQGYQQPAVDINAELEGVKREIEEGNFQNQYDFETAIQKIINAAHDDHLTIQGGILSAFVYGAPFDVVSLSEDGIQLPKVYLADHLYPDGWDNLDADERPSPIANINGQDPTTYLSQFATLNSIGKLEPHAEWNMLMRSGALDSQRLLEVFFGGATSYPGDSITFTLENGDVVGPYPWLALYLGPPNTGPLQTGGDFYNLFVLGLYPASYRETVPPPASSTPASSAFPSATSSYSKPNWDKAYPTPQSIPDGNSEDNGLPRVFFLNESSLGVLSIPEFTAGDDATVNRFLKTVKYFLSQSKKAGLKKLVIDVQQNTGGTPLLAIETFKLIFPSTEPFAGSRRRAHPMADALGSIITPYWKNLTSDYADYYYLLADEWMIADRLNADTGEEYAEWNDYYQSANSYGDDKFTKLERYNLTNANFMQEAAQINISNIATSRDPLYSAEDIVILSDGLCSSACALFMELMHHQAKVRTVAVGGKPDYTPMQAPSGTRGAVIYGLSDMDTDILGARQVDNSSTILPADRAPAFYISQGSVNLRDQIRADDSSNTPLQFHYMPADCRIFFTPKTWYNFTNLWSYAANATWQTPTLCVAKSASSSPPGPSSRPSQTLGNPNPSQTASDSQQPDKNTGSHEILDHASKLPTTLGSTCTRNCECSYPYRCEKADGFSKKICTHSCIKVNGPFGSSCGSGDCQVSYYTYEKNMEVKNRPPLRIGHGFCIPRQQNIANKVVSNVKSVFSSVTGDDVVDSPPCMADLKNAYVHCFKEYKGCFQTCALYRKGDTKFDNALRFCTQSELDAWKRKPGVVRARNYYDSDKAVAYLNEKSSSPFFIVFHQETLDHFMYEFYDLMLADFTSPEDWPIELGY